MACIAAGAFDDFANAKAAAEDLQTSAFVPEEVEITSNPANPDRVPGVSVRDELTAMRGTLERHLTNLLAWNARRGDDRRERDEVRRGGVRVAVPVGSDGERVLAQNILRTHRGLEVEYVAGGAPLY